MRDASEGFVSSSSMDASRLTEERLRDRLSNCRLRCNRLTQPAYERCKFTRKLTKVHEPRRQYGHASSRRGVLCPARQTDVLRAFDEPDQQQEERLLRGQQLGKRELFIPATAGTRVAVIARIVLTHRT